MEYFKEFIELLRKIPIISNYIEQDFLNFERCIDDETQTFIGILYNTSNPITNLSNPISAQAIKIGSNGKIKRLKTFYESDNYIKFEYESNISLTINKKNKEIIIYIRDPQNRINIQKPIKSTDIEIYKPFNLDEFSIEYDKIENFIISKFEYFITDNGKYLINNYEKYFFQ